MDNEMTITIRYQRRGADGPSELTLGPQEYFEDVPPHDSGDTPIHDHAADYLAVDVGELEWTLLEIRDAAGKLHESCREFFWNRGRNRLIQSTADGETLVILQILSRENPRTWQTVRCASVGGSLSPLEHLEIVEEEGREIVRVLYPREKEVVA